MSESARASYALEDVECHAQRYRDLVAKGVSGTPYARAILEAASRLLEHSARVDAYRDSHVCVREIATGGTE